jgi:glutathione synthase/RimK-type ligase-like ATP-grasp enzyme
MKTVVIFCESLALDGPTFEGGYYWGAYTDLLLLLKKNGVRAYFATDQATYMGNGVFSEAYTLTAKGSVDDLVRVPFVRADVVYDRAGFQAHDVLVINPEEVMYLGNDKTAMYETFGKYQVFSVVCNTPAELHKAMNQITTDKVVVKEPVGTGGNGVFIGERTKVLADIAEAGLEYPLLAQSFMDTSVGVPGFVEGTHDLRIEMGNGEVWGCYARTPKAGELRANMHLGGSAHRIPRNKVPKGAVALAKRIDAYFGNAPRYYALDFANTTEGWKLIELNCWPGLGQLHDAPEVKYVLTKLAAYLTDLARTTGKRMQLGVHNWPPRVTYPLPTSRLSPGTLPH